MKKTVLQMDSKLEVPENEKRMNNLIIRGMKVETELRTQ